ncbi:MAG: anti-sigma factor antagonist [Clostridia bacterium]|nr:anti-sigma factor antagonist [Clostridia bacterium]
MFFTSVPQNSFPQNSHKFLSKTFLSFDKTSYFSLLEKNENSNIINFIILHKEDCILESEFLKEDKLLLIKITEEIDHHSTEKIRRMADNEITRYMPRKVLFDFSKVSFMDSAGIGMIIGRYKTANMLGGTVEMTNVKPSIQKIFEMSGVLKIIPVVKSA